MGRGGLHDPIRGAEHKARAIDGKHLVPGRLVLPRSRDKEACHPTFRGVAGVGLRSKAFTPSDNVVGSARPQEV